MIEKKESGLIDLHCHLLPDLDDGPATWEETIQLARELVREGVCTVAATPHSYGQGGRDKNRVLDQVKEARSRFHELGIPLEVLPGMEITLTMLTLPGLKGKKMLPIGESRTILLETSAYTEAEEISRAVDQIKRLGYQVLLAHPEKIETLYDDPDMLVPLVKKGLLTQITAASVAGLNGERKKQLCQDLLHRGLAHVIASDAHAAEGSRRPAMQAGLRATREILGEKAIHLFTSVPRLILEGKRMPQIHPILSERH